MLVGLKELYKLALHMEMGHVWYLKNTTLCTKSYYMCSVLETMTEPWTGKTATAPVYNSAV